MRLFVASVAALLALALASTASASYHPNPFGGRKGAKLTVIKPNPFGGRKHLTLTRTAY